MCVFRRVFAGYRGLKWIKDEIVFRKQKNQTKFDHSQKCWCEKFTKLSLKSEFVFNLSHRCFLLLKK